MGGSLHEDGEGVSGDDGGGDGSGVVGVEGAGGVAGDAVSGVVCGRLFRRAKAGLRRACRWRADVCIVPSMAQVLRSVWHFLHVPTLTHREPPPSDSFFQLTYSGPPLHFEHSEIRQTRRGIRKQTFRHYDISQGYPFEMSLHRSFAGGTRVGLRPHTTL